MVSFYCAWAQGVRRGWLGSAPSVMGFGPATYVWCVPLHMNEYNVFRVGETGAHSDSFWLWATVVALVLDGSIPVGTLAVYTAVRRGAELGKRPVKLLCWTIVDRSVDYNGFFRKKFILPLLSSEFVRHSLALAIPFSLCTFSWSCCFSLSFRKTRWLSTRPSFSMM